MGLLSGKYNDALNGPPEGSRFSESMDKFAEFMRENYGNEEWNDNVAKVAKLKPIVESLGGHKHNWLWLGV